jgi:hypothetical protein
MEKPTHSRLNSASRAIATLNVFAQGSFKVVYEGTYTNGKRRGKACVLKRMASGYSWLDSVFDDDLRMVEKALEIVRIFNDARHVSKRIVMSRPEVWEAGRVSACRAAGVAGMLVLVEPMIVNFQKFNSNSGWVSRDQQIWTKVMQVWPLLSFTVIFNVSRRCQLSNIQKCAFLPFVNGACIILLTSSISTLCAWQICHQGYTCTRYQHLMRCRR